LPFGKSEGSSCRSTDFRRWTRKLVADVCPVRPALAQGYHPASRRIRDLRFWVRQPMVV